jgi:hypothetical protein
MHNMAGTAMEQAWDVLLDPHTHLHTHTALILAMAKLVIF